MSAQDLAGMFWSRLEQSGATPAQMVKRDGQWRTLGWSEIGEAIRELALGLLALDLRPGRSVALLGTSRPEWVQADLAILSIGAVTVPIYSTYTPELIAHIHLATL